MFLPVHYHPGQKGQQILSQINGVKIVHQVQEMDPNSKLSTSSSRCPLIQSSPSGITVLMTGWSTVSPVVEFHIAQLSQ